MTAIRKFWCTKPKSCVVPGCRDQHSSGHIEICPKLFSCEGCDLAHFWDLSIAPAGNTKFVLKPCLTMLNGNECKYGDRCRFFHDSQYLEFCNLVTLYNKGSCISELQEAGSCPRSNGSEDGSDEDRCWYKHDFTIFRELESKAAPKMQVRHLQALSPATSMTSGNSTPRSGNGDLVAAAGVVKQAEKTAEFEKLQAEKKQADAKIAELEVSLQQQQTTLGQFQTANHKFVEAEQQLRAQIAGLQVEVHEKNGVIKHLTSSLAAVVAENDALKADLAKQE